MLSCDRCGKEFDDARWLEVHRDASHSQSLTDAEGCCKMCGELVEEAGRHLRQVCDPPR
jgi:hypothetical protein